LMLGNRRIYWKAVGIQLRHDQAPGFWWALGWRW